MRLFSASHFAVVPREPIRTSRGAARGQVVVSQARKRSQRVFRGDVRGVRPISSRFLSRQRERVGRRERGQLAKNSRKCFREADKLARSVGWNVVFLPHVDPCETHTVMILFLIAFASVCFRRGLFCLYPIHHLGEQCCQLATGSQIKRLFESMTVG